MFVTFIILIIARGFGNLSRYLCLYLVHRRVCVIIIRMSETLISPQKMPIWQKNTIVWPHKKFANLIKKIRQSAGNERLFVRRSDQMLTANLRELPISNPPFAGTYCIVNIEVLIILWVLEYSDTTIKLMMQVYLGSFCDIKTLLG